MTDAQKPLLQQYKSQDGQWRNFMDERHRESTVKSGEWLIRDLYAHPQDDEALQSALARVEALEADAARYRWLRRGDYSIAFSRSVLNDMPYGIDTAIDAAMKGNHD